MVPSARTKWVQHFNSLRNHHIFSHSRWTSHRCYAGQYSFFWFVVSLRITYCRQQRRRSRIGQRQWGNRRAHCQCAHAQGRNPGQLILSNLNDVTVEDHEHAARCRREADCSRAANSWKYFWRDQVGHCNACWEYSCLSDIINKKTTWGEKLGQHHDGNIGNARTLIVKTT